QNGEEETGEEPPVAEGQSHRPVHERDGTAAKEEGDRKGLGTVGEPAPGVLRRQPVSPLEHEAAVKAEHAVADFMQGEKAEEVEAQIQTALLAAAERESHRVCGVAHRPARTGPGETRQQHGGPADRSDGYTAFEPMVTGGLVLVHRATTARAGLS